MTHRDASAALHMSRRSGANRITTSDGRGRCIALKVVRAPKLSSRQPSFDAQRAEPDLLLGVDKGTNAHQA